MMCGPYLIKWMLGATTVAAVIGNCFIEGG